MNAPEISFKHIRHIDFHSADRHYLTKEINKLIGEVIEYMRGDCPHRPDEIRLLKDQETNKAAGGFCIWCDQEIEIKKVVWGPKSRFPMAPKSA
jgi:hypothetical protein